MTQEYSLDQLKEIHDQPLMDLVYQAASVHRKHHSSNSVQRCSLLSIKTGGCPEDCSYCPQSARYNTGLKRHKLLDVEEVVGFAQKAKDEGSSRVCLGAAWREVKDGKDFDQVLEMVKQIKDLNLEVCCTLGMLNGDQAMRLKEAGLFAYNHNLDSSPDYYKEIISTRSQDDRLNTLNHARSAGLTLCSGGIIGMGESIEDRLKMLLVLSSFRPAPESVPINALVPVEGTPLADAERIHPFELVRMVAVARIALPTSVVRLSAGRTQLSQAEQTLCFLAGANSIFSGEKLLTTANPEKNEDDELFDVLGLEGMRPYSQTASKNQDYAGHV